MPSVEGMRDLELGPAKKVAPPNRVLAAAEHVDVALMEETADKVDALGIEA